MLRELSIVRGWPDARETLAEWRSGRFGVVLPWLLVSLLVAGMLLALVWLVGEKSPGDPTPPRRLPGEPFADPAGHAIALLRNNVVVLALHAAACLAGYIVHVAMTEPSDGGSERLERWTRGTASVAVAFVPVATLLSIGTQAWVLGSYLSTAALHTRLDPGALLATTLPHSVVELTAVFLPLAASMVLLARRRASRLFAATLLSVAVALPMLAYAAWSESYTWPQRVEALRVARPVVEGRHVGTLEIDPTDHFSASIALSLAVEAVEGTYETPQAAARAAAGPSTAGPALAIVATPGGYVVHHVDARWLPGHCELADGVQPRAITFELQQFPGARFLPDFAPERPGEVPVAVLGFVDGPVQRSVAQLTDVERERSFGRCDESSAG